MFQDAVQLRYQRLALVWFVAFALLAVLVVSLNAVRVVGAEPIQPAALSIEQANARVQMSGPQAPESPDSPTAVLTPTYSLENGVLKVTVDEEPGVVTSIPGYGLKLWERDDSLGWQPGYGNDVVDLTCSAGLCWGYPDLSTWHVNGIIHGIETTKERAVTTPLPVLLDTSAANEWVVKHAALDVLLKPEYHECGNGYGDPIELYNGQVTTFTVAVLSVGERVPQVEDDTHWNIFEVPTGIEIGEAVFSDTVFVEDTGFLVRFTLPVTSTWTASVGTYDSGEINYSGGRFDGNTFFPDCTIWFTVVEEPTEEHRLYVPLIIK
jgi:hypothetical protein